MVGIEYRVHLPPRLLSACVNRELIIFLERPGYCRRLGVGSPESA